MIKYILSLLQIFLFVDLCPQLYTSKVHYCNTNQYEKDLFFTVFTDRSVKNPEQLWDSFAGDPARTAASWGRVGPRDATASAFATRNPAYAGPGLWPFISL